jgi:hypothetical protein
VVCSTLIISKQLGEGVIGLTKSVTKIQSLGEIDFSPAAIGTVVSALLIIVCLSTPLSTERRPLTDTSQYFVYQLYFDNVEMEHFGILRQQIWTFLHFPFHMALVLLMEGTNQLVSWRHITEYMFKVFGPIFAVLEGIQSSGSFPPQSVIVDAFNVSGTAVLNNLFFSFTDQQVDKILHGFGIISSQNGTNITDGTITTYGTPGYEQVVLNVFIELLQIVFSGYEFEPPELEDDASPQEIYNKYFGVFNLIFVYFFVCAGIVLISFGVLTWVTLKEKEKSHRSRYIGIIANVVLGVAVALLSIMETTSAAGNLGVSAWTLPLLVIVLFVALLLNHTPWGMKLPHVASQKLRFTSRGPQPQYEAPKDR